MARKRKTEAAPSPALLAEAARVCACFNLRKVARAVTRLYDERLQPSGLRSTQFVILVAIGAEEEVTLPRLARVLDLDRSTLTRNLQPLERDGLLVRPASGGARSLTVKLSSKGQRLLERTIPLWKTAQEEFESRLGASRWQDVLDSLERVRDASRP